MPLGNWLTRRLGASLCVQDDATALDLPTLRRWNLILRVFFCEYLGLDPLEVSSIAATEKSRSEQSTQAEGTGLVGRSESELVSVSFRFDLFR